MIEASETPEPILETPAETSAEPLTNDQLKTHVFEYYKQGKSLRQIAVLTDCTLSRVYRSFVKLRKELGALVMTREKVHEKLFNLAPRAVDLIDETMDNKRAKAEVRLKAAQHALDYGGFAPVQRSINVSIVEEMTRDQLIDGLRSLANSVQSRHISPIQPTSAANGDDTQPTAASAQPDATSHPPANPCTPAPEGGVADKKLSGGTAAHTPASPESSHLRNEGAGI